MKRNDILTPQIKEKIYEGFKGSAWKTIKNFIATHGDDLPKVDIKRRKDNAIKDLVKKVHKSDHVRLEPTKDQLQYINDVSEQLVISKHKLDVLYDLEKQGKNVSDQITYHKNVVAFAKERLEDTIKNVQIFRYSKSSPPVQQPLPGKGFDF